MRKRTEVAHAGGAERKQSLLPIAGVAVALVAVLERAPFLIGPPGTFVVCEDVPVLSERLAHESAMDLRLTGAGLVVAVTAQLLARLRAWRGPFPALAFAAVVALLVLADGYAARADAVAGQLRPPPPCAGYVSVWETSHGWFDWSPLDP